MSTSAHAIQEVPLGKIFPSATNPRTEFPEDHITSLAASIEKDGVLQNVILRRRAATSEDVLRARGAGLKPKFGPGDDDAYELVIGECRLRASSRAGKETIPARISDLDDATVQRMQIVENLKRKDLRAMDEATGYKRLLDQGMSLDDIAKEIDMSISYVSARASLTRLVDDGKELLRTGYLSPAHAILIARIPDRESQQAALRVVYTRYGSFNDKDKRPLPVIAREWVDGSEKDFIEPNPIMSEKALREWIKENCNLLLKNAAWKLDDADLYPEAGPCTTCPHMSGNDQALFAEVAADKKTCMNPACYQEKKKRYIKIELENAAAINKPMQVISEKSSYTMPKEGAKVIKQGQWVEAEKGDCPDTKLGIFQDGESAGSTRYVCDNPKCKKHKHHLQQPDNIPKVDYEAERKKREQECGIENSVRFGRTVAILEEINGITDHILMAAAKALVSEVHHEKTWQKLAKDGDLGNKKLSELKPSDPAFAKVLAAALLCVNADCAWTPENGRKEFDETIRALGPQFGKMLDRDFRNEPDKQTPAQNKKLPAKPKGKKKAKK